MRFVSTPYITPAGMVDVPYCYLYDASGLTDGVNTDNVVVPIQNGGDFILRHIAGVPLCVDTLVNGGRFSYKSAVGKVAVRAVTTQITLPSWRPLPIATAETLDAAVFPNNWAVLPEKLYPFNSRILLSFYKILRSNVACGGGVTIYNSFIGFFGVRRLPSSQYQWYDTPFAFNEEEFRYNVPFTITWAATDPVPRQVLQTVNDYDFELLRILVTQTGAAGGLPTPDFHLTLYDPYDKQLSSAPVPQSFVNSACIVSAGVTLQPPYQGVFPVPPVTYPQGSQIKIDIVSKLCAASLNQSYVITLQGKRRIPA